MLIVPWALAWSQPRCIDVDLPFKLPDLPELPHLQLPKLPKMSFPKVWDICSSDWSLI